MKKILVLIMIFIFSVPSYGYAGEQQETYTLKNAFEYVRRKVERSQEEIEKAGKVSYWGTIIFGILGAVISIAFIESGRGDTTFSWKEQAASIGLSIGLYSICGLIVDSVTALNNQEIKYRDILNRAIEELPDNVQVYVRDHYDERANRIIYHLLKTNLATAKRK